MKDEKSINAEHVIHDVVRTSDRLKLFANGKFSKYDLYAIKQIILREPNELDLVLITKEALRQIESKI